MNWCCLCRQHHRLLFYIWPLPNLPACKIWAQLLSLSFRREACHSWATEVIVQYLWYVQEDKFGSAGWAIVRKRVAGRFYFLPAHEDAAHAWATIGYVFRLIPHLSVAKKGQAQGSFGRLCRSYEDPVPGPYKVWALHSFALPQFTEISL